MAVETPAAAPSRRGSLGRAGGLLVALVSSWSGASLGGMVPELADSYGVGIAAIGLLVTLSYAGNLVAQIPAGLTLDRIGPRLTAIGGVSLILTGSVVGMVDDLYPLAAIARVLVGVGIAGSFLGGIEFLRQSEGSPVVQGFFGAFNGLGVMTLAAVPFLANWLSWRAPFVSTAVLAVVCLALLLVAPTPARPSAPGSVVGLAALRTVIGDGLAYRTAFTVLVPVPISFIGSAWMATLLVERHDASPTAAGATAALVVVGGVLTRPLGGVVAKRSRRSIGICLAITMTIGGIATAVATFAPSLAVAVPAAAVMGLATGVPFPLGFGAAARLHPGTPGQSVALVNMCVVLSVVLGIALLGLTFSPLGDGRIGFLALTAAWLAPLPFLPGTLSRLGRRGAM